MNAASTTAPSPPAAGAPGRARAALAGGTAALAAGLAAGLVVVVAARGAAPYTALGVSAPADLVRYGTPLLRAVAGVAGALCLGGLVAGCFVLPAGGDVRTGLGADGYAAVRAAGTAGVAWAGASALLVVFTVAGGTGGGLEVVGSAGFGAAVAALEEPAAWLVSAVAASVAAAVGLGTLSWRAAAFAVLPATLAVVAPPAAGHAASVGADHDVVTDAAVLAATALSVWLGATVAVTAHLRRGRPGADVACRRLTRLATVCAPVAVASVLVLAAWFLPTGWTSTSYGAGTLVEILLVVLAAGAVVVGRARGRTPRLLPAASLVSALAVAALLATDTPPGMLDPSTVRQILLGYDLDGPPSLAELLGHGRVNVLFDLAGAALAVAYVLGVRRLRRRGDAWPVGRTAAWVGGCVLLVWSTSSGVGRYAMAMFSVHMGLHMLLSMLVPVLLVLGGPVTLALRALPAAGHGRHAGAREWVVALTTSPAARLLTHPLVALVLFVGSFYALYFSPLFASALPYHWAHQLMNLHFVVVGYLFFWPIIGVDHAPTTLPHVGRLGLLLASMPFHAFFGVTLMASDTVIGERFYAELALPWVPDLLADQSIGGGIAWAAGELPLLVVVIALLVQWSGHDERAAARHDRRADRDGDAELAAWNEMLADMARRRG